MSPSIMKRVLIAVPICLISFLLWRIIAPYEDVSGMRARWLAWANSDCIVLQLGDWFRAQSPSLALLQLNEDKASAYELTGEGMDRYHGFRGVAFDIDESRRRIAVLCVDAADQLELGLGTVSLNQQSNRWSVNLKESVVVGMLRGQLNIDSEKPVAAMSFCDSGRCVVLSYDAKTIVVDFENGQLYSTELAGHRFRAARNAPYIVVNYEASCQVWWISKKDQEKSIKLKATSFGLDCSLDLKDPETGLVRNPSDIIESLAISEDGNLITVGTNKGIIGYRDSKDRLKGSIHVNARIASVQFAESSQRILFGTHDQRIGQWDLDSGKVTWIDNCSDVVSNPILRLKLSSDDKRIYATDYESRKLILLRKQDESYKRDRVVRMERDDFRSLRAEFFSRKAKKE